MCTIVSTLTYFYAHELSFNTVTLPSPQYYEIYKHREVVGISILFIIVDLLGGVFNDLSLAFKSEFDVIAGVTYSLVVVSVSFEYSVLLRTSLTRFLLNTRY